jgi:hypothetical protein
VPFYLYKNQASFFIFSSSLIKIQYYYYAHIVDYEALRDNIIIAFFFNARGSQLEKTPIGFYRSILHDLVLQDRQSLEKLLQVYRSKNEIVSSKETKWQWQRGELQNFLRQIFSTSGMRSTWLTVDGLDECDEKGVRDVVYYLRDLTDLAFEKNIRLNVCVSSRHYPTITIPRCPEIIVEDGNTEDIEKYIKARMAALQEDEFVLEMQAEIISKANGIFLWVVIVVQVLLTEWDNGGTVKEMNKTLHKVPGQLSQLFASLFTTLKDEERGPAVILFQLVLVSLRTWTPVQLCCAVTFAQRPYQSLKEWHDTQGSLNEFQCTRKIRNLSRGLIEVKTSSPMFSHSLTDTETAKDLKDVSTVQFIHETVRDLLIHENGFAIIDSELGNGGIGKAHNTVLRACLNIISIKEIQETHILGRIPRFRWKTQYPSDSNPAWNWVIKYLPSNMFHHALKAEEQGIIALEMVQQLSSNSYALWEYIRSIKDGYGPAILLSLSEGGAAAALLCAFCENGLSLCTETLLAIDHSGINEKAGRYSYALLAAAARDHVLSARALLKAGADVHVRAALDSESGGDETVQTALHFAAENGSTQLATLLLEFGANINDPGSSGRMPFYVAVENASQEFIVLLKERGAQIEGRNWKLRTPLHEASRHGTLQTVKLLLRFGADVHAKDFEGKTPLHLAALWNRGL